MPAFRPRRGRPRAAASLRARATALTAALALVAASAILGAPTAQAVPKGAYWYTLLDLQRAWKITEGAGVTVAVVDAGVQADLGDLRGQVLRGLDLSGADPGAQREEPETKSSQFGHGTDMAALIAGTGKGAGLVGVAPRAKILPVDVQAPGGSISGADIARGISWSVDHGARVVNVSLGQAGECSPAVAAALKYAYQHDVVVVVSSGDEAGPVDSPANCPGALAVGAVDSAVQPWTKSASGAQVAFVAPGFNLVNDLLNNTVNGPNTYNAGTSQAAAIASGTIALLRAKFPHDTARQIITRALYSVHNGLGAGKFGQRASDALGYGMILPYYALTHAPPADAKNPIYDQWARDFAASSAPPAASGSSTASSASSGPGSSSSSQASAASSSAGTSPALIVVIVLVALALVALVVVLVRRRGGARGPAGNPPAPPRGRG